MTQTITTDLQPIVNGSFNQELTNEQILCFDFETKKRIAWNLIVSLGFAHSFRDIAPEVFIAVPSKWSYDMLTLEYIDTVVIDVREAFNNRQRQLNFLTNNYYYGQGKQIHEAQKRLQFGGMLEMNIYKLQGYISAIGNWNDFSSAVAMEAVEKLDEICPAFYIKNNPNNGLKKHIWTVGGDYITMKFSYLGNEDKERYMNFYKEYFEPTAKKINADSVRFELEELPNNAFSLELIMWWD